jgi:predicted ATPase/class 3 adenylate cyclase
VPVVDHRGMARELPSGVVTLLFTDVEGSTRLLHELGAEAYGAALNEHRRVLRSCFDEHEGVEVDTQGDAFFVAFARATDAVAAAADGQRALAAGPIRVRMGLHTGEVRQTEEGYVGLEVHRGARIAAVGHGGQVLLSATTQALAEAPTRDLGPHRLKDITTPERIHQLEIEGLPSEFPLLKTLEAGITTLPAPRTSFVGRTRELAEIDGLLEDPACRLLTLVGPGGAGKTRLALEAAARRVDRYPHGVHFVSLAPVASPELLAPAVADSLQFSVDAAHSGTPAREQLLDFLAERSTLLVLDNFEHLVEGAELLSQVVERSPKVEILTTSRERLNVQSEWVLDVAGLGEEDEGALRLFVERARQLDTDFALDGDEHEQAVRICRLVDGMPLGIELAASWTAMLSCAEIADEIERGIDLLETSARDVPERHRSLRAAFDQSWRLLTDAERETFARISVFRGGFTREAAAGVADAGLPLLTSLTSKSLVRRQGLGRFDQHELVRQYGAGRLAELPGELAPTGERHARYYLGRLADRAEQLLGTDMAVARDELRVDVDNMITAADWALREWDVEEARAALRDLRLFYFNHGEFKGGTAFVHLAESVVGDDWASLDPALAKPFERCVILHAAAQGNAAGYTEVGERVARAYLPTLRESGTPGELLECLLTLGILDCYQDDYPASAAELGEAVSVARELGDDLGMSIGLSWLGFVLLLQDDLVGARDAFEE